MPAPTDMGALALLLVALPFLIGASLTPNATLFNQLAALVGWGCVLLVAPQVQTPRRAVLSPFALTGWVLLIAYLLSPYLNGLPWSLTLSTSALLAAFLAVYLLGQGLSLAQRETWWAWTCRALVLAGVLSAFVAIVQVFFPELSDGSWIVRSGLPGRAIGNMRQPNHLASLLMWSCIAAIHLSEHNDGLERRLQVLLTPALLLCFILAIVLSASRTGMLAVVLLLAWGCLDRGLSRRSRISLLSTPVMLALCWAMLSWWAHSQQHVFGAESRLSEGAGSPSRLAVLSNALGLLRQYPWTGVGAGEFNLAWTMTPFPDRPVSFFDHTHDLPMQLFIELGAPLGLITLVLLGWGFWRAWHHCVALNGAEARTARSALMFVLMIGLHSLLEYPLWYSYFLLPTAFALAICSPLVSQAGGHAFNRAVLQPLKSVGVMLVLGALFAAWDYNKAVVIYAPPANASSLEDRIKVGQNSLFFAHLADYAAATSLRPGPEALAAAKRTAHNLIDVRLMMAWARSLHATGDTDRARYVVARLREFRNAAAQDWLDECLDIEPGQAAPFQCEAPKRDYSFREMR